MDKLSNCQFNHRPQSRGFFERGIFQKNSPWFLAFILFITIGVSLPNKVLSQIITPVTPFVINNPGCNQNNLRVVEIEFRDSNGNVFNPNDLDGTPIGTPIDGEIWARWAVSGNGYNPHIQYDIFVNDLPQVTQANCVVVENPNGTTRNVVNGEIFKISNFSWNYGDKLEIKNLYINWVTGNAKADNKNCPTSAGNSQCSFPGVTFLVRTPLVANFEFITNCDDFTVDFTNLTTGGNPDNYTFSWTFQGGTPAISSVPSPQNINFQNPGTYQVTLISTSEGIVKQLIKEVTLYPVLDLDTSKEDDDCSILNTGSIDLTVAGGLAPYTYLWSKTGDANFSFSGEDPSGLSAGTYSVLVTDARDCKATTSVSIIKPMQSPVPSVKTFDFCQGSGNQLLTVSPASGYMIKWYDSAMNPLQGAPTVSTSSAGTESFYITQFKEGECESEMAEVTVTINPAPAAPTSPVNVTICEGDAESITASATVPQGFSIVWYTTADGDVTTESPSLSTVGTITYYAASVNNETECESLTRTPVTLTILAAPAAPTDGKDIIICEGDQESITASASVPEGFSIVWYNLAVGGSEVSDPSLSEVGSITYYAEAVNDETGCVSLTRTPVVLSILDAPAPPVSRGDITICEGDVEKITASAFGPGTIVWYTEAVGGEIVADPSLSTVGSITYYAQSEGESCSSLERTPVTLTILAAPATPINPVNVTICEGDAESITASATVPQGFSIVWYTTADGDVTTESPSLSTVGTITYYAASVNNETECESLTRTAVTLTIQGAPIAPVSGGNQIVCETIEAQNLVATATVPAGFSVVWYNAPDGGSVIATPSLSTVGTVTYYAQAVNNETGCSSLTRTAVSLTIVQGPTPPVSGGDQVVCATVPLQTLTASATAPGTLVWYNAPVGGDVVSNPILNTVGTVTYYAQTVDGSCASLQRTPVTLTILPAPVAPVSGGDQVACASSDVQSLTATASVPGGFNIVWYSASVGGSVVQNPTLSSVGSVTYYAEAVNSETGCVSNGRTPVTLTIFNCDISITKTSDVSTVNAAGDVITYTLTLTNSGNVTLVNVTVVDPLTGLNQTIGTLIPGGSQSLTTSYTVTQDDMDSGEILNVATVSALGPDETEVSAEDEALVRAVQSADITVDITDNDAVITEAGQEIVYTITVTNTGNVTLENVTIVDSKTGLVINIGTLKPGESKSVDTTPYVVTQEDVDKGSVTNETTATGESPSQG
ncbi:PKD domain-containing protein, partial [Algoriphagus sp.]|uniref:Ig-like domain-containing protein n=1 Tax=Algoriphagus sp. TaxID=1872435 RepID=UPI00271824C2